MFIWVYFQSNLSISTAQISVFKAKYLQGSLRFGWAVPLISTV